MNAVNVADKLVSLGRIFIFSALIALPANAQAEYYLVYGPPEVPTVCDFCQSPQPYYRPVHKVKTHKHSTHKKYYRAAAPRKRNHYSITVYYPVPTYEQTPCSCCGGFIAPTYYWVPSPYRVYVTHPDDRLVGNRYEDNLRDPSLDTGTADNDY